MKKLKDILNESMLGNLYSDKLFKYNKATGKYDAPKSVKEETIDEDESVNEAKNDWMATGDNIDIWVKGLQPDSKDEIGEKTYYALLAAMKKKKLSPKEIIVKF